MFKRLRVLSLMLTNSSSSDQLINQINKKPLTFCKKRLQFSFHFLSEIRVYYYQDFSNELNFAASCDCEDDVGDLQSPGLVLQRKRQSQEQVRDQLLRLRQSSPNPVILPSVTEQQTRQEKILQRVEKTNLIESSSFHPSMEETYLLKHPGVKKKILAGGRGTLPHFPPGTKVV